MAAANGLDIFTTLIGGAFDIGANAYNNTAAAQREQIARRENYDLNEMAAENADKRTRALYSDLYSPKAQIQQLKEAGLSPSVYYDGGPAGMSGQSGAQGAGASGISPTIFGADPLTGAQIANLLAEADLKKEQANEYRGENAIGQAKVKDLLAEAGYKEQSAKLAKAQEEGQDLDNYIRTQGMNAELFEIKAKANRAGYDAEIAYESLEQAKLLTSYKKETYITEVEIRKQTLNDLIQGITESKSRTQLNKEQAEMLKAQAMKLYNDITLGWAELDVQQQNSQGYLKYVNKRCEMMPQELDAQLKDIAIREKRMYIDAVTETIKSIAIGAMAASQFKGGNPVMTNGNGAGGKMPTKRGGNAVNPNQYNPASEVWEW